MRRDSRSLAGGLFQSVFAHVIFLFRVRIVRRARRLDASGLTYLAQRMPADSRTDGQTDNPRKEL
jgi:hypothetical protein